MKYSKIIFVFFFVLTVFFIFPDNLNISDKSLEEYINDLKNNKKELFDSRYLWSGVLIEIKNTDNGIEAVILKGKWIEKQSLESYKFIIKTDKKKFIDQINGIGLYKKIILILKVIDIKDEIIPVCEPIIIKDV